MDSTIASVRSPKVGDILHSSWGYDQTNCSFYLVTNVTGARVTLQELRNIETRSKETWVFGTAVPDLNSIRGNVFTKGFTANEKGYYVKVTNYAGASLWDGKPVEVSHTH